MKRSARLRFLALTVLCVANGWLTVGASGENRLPAPVIRAVPERMAGRYSSTYDGANFISADPSVPENWLAQKVCVDRRGAAAKIDPYSSANPFGDACPRSYTIRNLHESDGIPYYKYYNPFAGETNPTRYRFTYAYETFSATGQKLYVMDRHFQPANVPDDWYVKPSYYPGSTHWDLYEIQDGWISNAATRDNTGLNQTFYGNLSGKPTPYNGWINFPISYFRSLKLFPPTQTTAVAVHGVYWEQSGLPWPTPSQKVSQTSRDTQTTWRFIPRYVFDSGKAMAALVSYHQSQPRPSDSNPDAGHIEAWFFSVPYGPSRWEVWSAATCLASNCSSYIQSSCRTHSATMTFPYKGINYTYYRTNCADWEQGIARAANDSTVPTLPIPQANLLADFHFSNDPARENHKATNWHVGRSLNFLQLQSSAPGDTRDGRFAGVRYAKISCSTACSATSSISQDVAARGSGVYSFGAEAKTASSSGTVSVSLSQIDAHGNVLGASNTITGGVDSLGDGSNCAHLGGVENCERYVGGRTPLHLGPGVAKLRVTVRFLTERIDYDVSSVFLSRV